MNTSNTQSARSDSSSFDDRLVPLCDGRPGLRGTMHVEIHEPVEPDRDVFHHVPNQDSQQSPADGSSCIRENSCDSCEAPSNPCLDFISSDETLDRYDEVISAAGWKLSSYHRNPVFQNAHQYGDIIFTLGKSLLTEVRAVAGRQALVQRVQFATDVNPMAKIAYGLYRGKFLNAVSVGFIPIRWETPNENPRGMTENSPGQTRNECRPRYAAELINSLSLAAPKPGEGGSLRTPHSALPTQQFRRRYIEQELLEVSAVAIPANPNALALGLKSGAVEKSDLQDLLDVVMPLVRTHTITSSIESPNGATHTSLGLERTKEDSGAPTLGNAANIDKYPRPVRRGEGEGEGLSTLSLCSQNVASHTRLINLVFQLNALLKHV